MLLWFGAIGLLCLAAILAAAVFMQPTDEETEDAAPQENSAPAKKPPLN
jgi:hypothetical protein